MAKQLEMDFETADIPEGERTTLATDRSAEEPVTGPKSKDVTGPATPTVSMEEVASVDNLVRAFERVASNRGAPGPNRQTIDEVREHLAEIVEKLSAELLEGTYRPGNVRRVWIPKAGGGERGLGIPDVIDRIAQQALHQVLSPRYERQFHPSSHGFRPDRSCHTAIAEAHEYVRSGRNWVIDIDLEKFFDTVPHDRLMARLEEHIGDRRILAVIRRLLRAKVVLPDGVVVSVEEGTPQGGPLSPLLSNIVLHELDQELARRGHPFVRYADDCNVYTRSKRSAERVMASLCRFIESRLGLKVNRTKSAVGHPKDRHFLGFSLSASRVDLSTRSLDRLKTKIRELTPRTWGQRMSDCIARINAYVRGWVNFFGIGTHLGATLKLCDAHLRRRLRAIFLAQWKKRTTVVRRLYELGVPILLARRAASGRARYWRRTTSKAVCRGLTNEHFASLGLDSFRDLWERQPRLLTAAEVPA